MTKGIEIIGSLQASNADHHHAAGRPFLEARLLAWVLSNQLSAVLERRGRATKKAGNRSGRQRCRDPADTRGLTGPRR